MKNKICELLNIEYPILQGAMAWISDASLVSAVSEAGGLGILASGNAPADILEKEIHKIKAATDKPFGLNVMLLSPYVDDVVELLCTQGVKVVTTGAGNPSKYMDKFKEKGIVVIPVVPSVALAKKMERVGADALIAEGMESGGHIGRITTMSLLPQVVDAVNIPVIGAGGIGDGRGMAAAFCLGAKGVQIGTRFLVAKECTVHQNYKNRILKASDIDTIVTGTLTGHPVRVIRNSLARQLEILDNCDPSKKQEHIEIFEALGAGSLQAAVIDGDVEKGSIMAGQISGMINKEQTSQEIILEIMEQFHSTLSAGKDWCK